jgi:hypothetical protein
MHAAHMALGVASFAPSAATQPVRLTIPRVVEVRKRFLLHRTVGRRTARSELLLRQQCGLHDQWWRRQFAHLWPAIGTHCMDGVLTTISSAVATSAGT